MPARREAFTLIEILVVLLLLAVLAGISVVSLGGTVRSAQIQDLTRQIIQCDHLLRQQARQVGRPLQLTFDLEAGRIARVDSAISAQAAPFVLPTPAKLERVVIAADNADESLAMPTLRCSAQGRTASYAVLVTVSPDDHLWLLMAGLSGEARTFTDASHVQDILALLAKRNDSD